MTWELGYAVERAFLDNRDVNLLRDTYNEIQLNNIEPSRQILYTHKAPDSLSPHLSQIAQQWFNLFRRQFSKPLDQLYEKVRLKLPGLGFKGYSLFQDSLIQKVATKTPFHWHQDYPFWPLDRPDAWTVWVALDPVSNKNGGIEIAVGSNQLGIEPVVDLHTGQPQIRNAKSSFRPEDFEVVCPDLEPGDALFFHSLAYHFSKPNKSNESRRAWASVWVGPDVKWKKSRAPRHFICKMVDDGEPVRGFWN
jgi:hypothetical protein